MKVSTVDPPHSWVCASQLCLFAEELLWHRSVGCILTIVFTLAYSNAQEAASISLSHLVTTFSMCHAIQNALHLYFSQFLELSCLSYNYV